MRQYPDFPILIETYRDCLEDVMDLPHLEEILADIQAKRIELTVVESSTPSPVAIGLMRQFTDAYMYEWDTPRAERQLQQLAVNRDLLQDVLKDVKLDDLLRPEAIQDVTGHLQRTTPVDRVRTAEELALLLDHLGDLTTAEIESRASRAAGSMAAPTGSTGTHPASSASSRSHLRGGGRRCGNPLGRRRICRGLRTRLWRGGWA